MVIGQEEVSLIPAWAGGIPCFQICISRFYLAAQPGEPESPGGCAGRRRVPPGYTDRADPFIAAAG